MATIAWPLNGTTGTAVTAANIRAGSVSVGSGSSATLLAAAAAQGSTGMRLVNGGTNAVVVRFDLPAPNVQTAWSVMFRALASAPTGSPSIWSFRDTASAKTCNVQYNSNGDFQFCDLNGSLTTILTAAQMASNANNYLRFEHVINVPNGTVQIRAYTTANAQVGSTISLTGRNLGSNPVKSVMMLSSATAGTYDFDSIQGADSITTEIGAYAPSPPVVSAGSDQTVPVGATVTCTGTAVDLDGTISSQTWTWVSYPTVTAPAVTGAATATASFVAPATAGNYVLQYAATDDSGMTSSDSVTVAVVASAAPTASVNQNIGLGIIDARSSVANAGGSLAYSIAPTGPTLITAGVWYKAPSSTAVTYTVTVTESTTGTTASASTTVAAATASATGTYTGPLISLTPPIPGDPTTDDTWGTVLNAQLAALRDNVNQIVDYING